MDVDVLTFRPTRTQVRYLTLLTVGLGLLAAVILLIRYAAGISLPDRVYNCGVAAAICTPLAGWVLLRYARAFTECSPAGIRSRGLTREWQCKWEYVREVAVRASTARSQRTYTVILTATDGGRLRLGMPVSGGIMPDPDFTAKVARIRAYWRDAAGADFETATAGLIPADTAPAPRVPVGSLVRLAVELILIGAIFAVPFTLRSEGPALLARLGYGQRGYVTVTAHACDANCFWVGDFHTQDPPATRLAVPIAPGARIGGPGQRVPAVYLGDGNLVYPADGGPDWIPLAVLLIGIAGSLPFATWRLVRADRGRRASVPGYEPKPPGRPGARSVTSGVAGLVLAAVIVVLTFAGAAIAYWAQDVPVAASASTLGCADFWAWDQAQPVPGGSDLRPGLLTDAAHAAAGQLRVALATLQADATAEIGAGRAVASQIVSIAVLDDMTAAAQDCA
jgi:hypothetical protein